MTRYFGDIAASDENWASPEFDHLQPYIATILQGPNGMSQAERRDEARRWRDNRPYLIAHLRKSMGDQGWDPRGARVRSLAAARIAQVTR